MLNYMKSEFYRVIHSSVTYCTTGILAALVFIMNFALYWFRTHSEDFPYGTTSYSFSTFVSSPMVYCYMVFIIAAILYESNKRNGNLKNTIAYGISRTKIFAGKCIVSLVTSLAMLVVVMTVQISSAVLLLEQTGPVKLSDLLMEIPAVSLIAVGALILSIVVLEYFDKSIVAMIVWFLIMVGVPAVLLQIGMKVDAVLNVALWMPENIFRTGVIANMSQCVTLWDTAQGMGRCLISGAAGILVFSIAGVLLLRKKEL